MTKTTWQHAPLDELCDHLASHHHERTRQLLGRARVILGELVQAFPGRMDLVELGRLMDVLEQDLSRHMLVEEMVLFPYVERLCGEPGAAELRPDSGAMHLAQHDHENATTLLAGINALANQLRADDHEDLARLFDALRELQADLAIHSGLEEDVLFPRLRALEERLARGR